MAIAVIAKEFGVLPSRVARDLATDPEQLSLVCLDVLRYAEAHAAWKRGNAGELKGWEASEMMDRVKLNDFAAAERELALAEGEE